MYCHIIGLNCRYTHSCLALFYVRSAIEHHLPTSVIEICQYTINDPYYETLSRISASEADALFFSVYIWNGNYIERLVRDLAKIQPDRPLILGGPQATVLQGLPSVCTVIEGEIEGVDNRFYRDMEHGCMQPRYKARSGCPFPFPYKKEDFAAELRNRQVYYESSRGCPFQCSYCLSSVRRGVEHKDIRVVEQELELILQHEPKIIRFVDRTFNDNPERALTLWRYMASHSGPTRFHFEIAPDRFTEEMLAFLETVAPDRFQFEIGIQSTNAQTLAAINRRMDFEAAAGNIIRLASFDNIHLHVDLILGLPYETEESYRDAFNRVFALEAQHIQMGLLKVLPGTAISRNTGEFGLIYCEQPPYQILANRWLSHRSLRTLYAFGECVEIFYNNRYFRSLWRYLRDRDEEPYRFFKALLAVSQRMHYEDLSPTQELLTRILCEMAEEREDRDIIIELLKYDWLRCGHRFLPEVFPPPSLPELRIAMWKKLPQNMEGLYTHQSRSAFFKRSVFMEMSGKALQQTGLDASGRDGIICFLPEQAGGVTRHCRTVLVELS